MKRTLTLNKCATTPSSGQKRKLGNPNPNPNYDEKEKIVANGKRLRMLEETDDEPEGVEGGGGADGTEERRHPERTTTVVMPVAIPRDRLDVALLNQRARSLFEALSTDQSRAFSIVRYFVPRVATKGRSLLSGSMD